MTKLKQLREARGMTQKGLAEAAGISARSIERIDQGGHPIDDCSLDKILKICIALKCDIGDVLEDRTLYDEYRANFMLTSC